MRLKNTLSVLCFLFVAVACSMEDDILNDLDTPTSAKTDSYAVFDISLLTEDKASTKASISEEESEPTTPSEGTVGNCFIAVVDEGGNVIANYYANNYPDGSRENTGEIVKKKIQTHIKVKVPEGESPNLQFVAFAQLGDYTTDPSDLQQCTSLNDLKKIVLKTHPNTAVKIGSITVKELEEQNPDWTLKTSSQNLIDEQCNTVTIPVKLRSARIQLDAFKVLGAMGAYKDVEVTGLQIQNTCRYTYMDSEYKGADRFEDTFIYIPYGLIPGRVEGSVNPKDYYGEYNEARFYVYENTDSNAPTSLKINYTYNNGEVGVCEFTIKSPDDNNQDGYADKVLANHLYKLDVTIKNATVNVGVKCVTRDWIYDANDADHNLEFTYND